MWGEVLKTHEIFNHFLAEIAESVSPSTYSVWFNDLELVSIDDKDIVIKVPLSLHKQILRTTYIDLIDETISSITGNSYNFKFLQSNQVVFYQHL